MGSRRHADGTGLKIWPTALPLLSHLQQLVRERFGHLERPLNILELGSGCGLLGIGLAATCHANVTLTDPAVEVNFSEERRGNTLEWLRENVAENQDAVGARARVAKLAWGDAADVEAVRREASLSGGFDLVVGSDLMYDPDRYEALLSALHALVTSRAVLGYPTRHGGEQRFLDMCEAGDVLRLASAPVRLDAAGRFTAAELTRREDGG